MDAPDPPPRILVSAGAHRWRIPFFDDELRLALRVMWSAYARQQAVLRPPVPVEGFWSEQEGCRKCELELALLDDAAMAALNTQYLAATGPTNILAFPAGGGEALGWLALSADTVRREARLYGQKLPLYIVTLLAHGFAHLLGHDHGALMDEASALAAGAALEALRQQGCL